MGFISTEPVSPQNMKITFYLLYVIKQYRIVFLNMYKMFWIIPPIEVWMYVKKLTLLRHGMREQDVW